MWGFFVCLCCFKARNKASAVTWKSTTGIEEGGDNNDVESLANVSPHEVCSVPKLNLFILQVVLKKKKILLAFGGACLTIYADLRVQTIEATSS